MNFDAQVSVSRIEDIGRFVAAVTIKCVECGLPFQFVGVQPGFNYDAPTVRLDGLEVDLPICPQGAQPNPLPIVAWAEYARESLIGVSMQYDEESPFLQRALADHAAATASLSSAQQRIEELERERDLTYRQWCGRDLMHLPLHEAVGARVAADAAQAEELERALGELVTPSQIYEAIAAEFSDDGVPWSRVKGDLRRAYRNYAKIINAWNRHAARAIGTREGGDANAAPGRSPESAVATATRPSEAYLRGISPQSAWPFAQDDKGTK